MSLHPYWNFRDELMIESGILMKNSKVLIPETLKQKYLKQIHQGHQGIEACRSRAREFVFWININNDLKELVEKRDLCQSQQNSTTIIQKYVSEVPPQPWHTIGSDLFYFRRIDFLVVDFEHRTSSPHYPQSNGLAESMVKVSKNLIEKVVRQDLPWNQLL